MLIALAELIRLTGLIVLIKVNLKYEVNYEISRSESSPIFVKPDFREPFHVCRLPIHDCRLCSYVNKINLTKQIDSQ
jgi:hypothetical protein